MPTATLTFNLPDEESEFKAASNGQSWQSLAWEIDQMLRAKIKYSDDSMPEAVVDALQEVRDFLHNERSSKGLTFD
jgi:hypothetical protein